MERSQALVVKFGNYGVVSNDISESTVELSIDRSTFLGFFESPIVPTYQTRNSSLDYVNSDTFFKRPSTAQPVRPPLNV